MKLKLSQILSILIILQFTLFSSCFSTVKDDEWITGDDEGVDLTEKYGKAEESSELKVKFNSNKASNGNSKDAEHSQSALKHKYHVIKVNKESRNVLVVLPLSGELENLGLKVKSAIVKTNDELEEPYYLSFFDTKSDMFSQKGDLYDYVIENDIKFIIGGLKTETSIDIAEVAAVKDILVFSLSPNAKITANHKNLFIQSITPENITHSVVKYAIEEKGFRKFAIFYPFSTIGEEYYNYFKYFVDSMGGEVTKEVAFNTKHSNLDKPISKLVERDNPYKRPEFARLIRKAHKFKDPYWKKRYIDRAKMKLSAKFDYDAIFLPVSNKRVNYIVPLLAAWDLPLQTNNARLMEQVYHKYLNKNQKYVQVFGTPFWYDEKLFDAKSPYINGSIFPSPFNIELDNRSIPFVLLFEDKIAKKESLIYEALVYDLVNIIYYVFEKKDDIESYDGVMGRYSLYKNQFFKDFGFMIIHNDRFLSY